MNKENQGERGDRGIIGERGPRGDSSGNGNGYPEGTPLYLKILLTSLRQFGVATIILLIGGYWLCTRVGEPLIATYTEFIHIQSKVAQDQAEAIKSLKDAETARIAAIKDTQILTAKFQEQAVREHSLMLANHAQQLQDHKEFMAEIRASRAPKAN